MLLNSPAVAAGWLQYLTMIRQQCSLDGRLRELVIIRIAILNGAPYEAEQHAPIALREGLAQAQIDDISRWEQSGNFNAMERAVLAYADAMTREVHVPEPVFAKVKACFDDQQLVELTATIAAYNMVSRFLEALQIRSSDAMT
jgi:AhpD family alkylhydroperoxidase